MAEIEKIGTEYIEYFAEIYEQAKRDAGKEPLLLSEKSRKSFKMIYSNFMKRQKVSPMKYQKNLKKTASAFSLCARRRPLSEDKQGKKNLTKPVFYLTAMSKALLKK